MAIGATTNADDVAGAFADLRRKFPREFASALIHVSYVLRKGAKEAVQYGKSDRLSLNLAFQPQSGITKRLSLGRLGFGGKLSRSIKAYSTKDTIFVGWPERMRMYGEAFQSAMRRPFSGREQRRLRAAGITQARIDRGYDRPAREVWGPLINARGTQRAIVDTVMQRLEKLAAAAARRAARKVRAAARVQSARDRANRRFRRASVRYAKRVRRASRAVARVVRKSSKSTRKGVRRIIKRVTG